MKILLCASTFQGITHGPAKFTNLVMKINELYAGKHEVRVLTKDITEEIPGSVYKFGIEYPRGIGVFWHYWDNVLYLKNVKRILKEYPADKIIFVDAVLGYWTAKKLGKEIDVFGLINDDEYIDNKFSDWAFTKQWFIKSKSRILERRAAIKFKKVIANSEFIKGKIIDKYQVNEPKTKRLYKSIDLQNFPARPFREIDKTQTIKILFVKNDFVRGGLFELIEALQHIQEYKFELRIIGPHVEEKQEILSKVSGKNLNAIFLGTQSQEEVLQELNNGDIFSVPSLREGLGVANIEALSVGIPVVTTDAGGIPEVLNQGKNGWISKAGDVSSLGAQLRNCILQKEETKNKVEQGMKYVYENFSHRKMIDKLLEIIN